VLEDLRSAEDCKPADMPDLKNAGQMAMDRITKKLEPEFRVGLDPGWKSMAKYFRPVTGEVTVVTGVPGSGKSEWLLSLCLNIATTQDRRFLLFCFEHTTPTITSSLIDKYAGLSFEKPPDSFMERLSYQDQVLPVLDKHFVYGSKGFSTLTIDDIAASIKKEAAKNELWGVVIDPYNYLAWGTEDSRLPETFRISRLLTRLKQLALEQRLHIFIVAHPAKMKFWTLDGPRPSLYDISGSAHWFNKVDNGLIVQRSCTATADGDPVLGTTCVVEVAKCRNREGGALGVATFEFLPEFSKYSEEKDRFVQWPEEDFGKVDMNHMS